MVSQQTMAKKHWAFICKEVFVIGLKINRMTIQEMEKA